MAAIAPTKKYSSEITSAMVKMIAEVGKVEKAVQKIVAGDEVDKSMVPNLEKKIQVIANSYVEMKEWASAFGIETGNGAKMNRKRKKIVVV